MFFATRLVQTSRVNRNQRRLLCRLRRMLVGSFHFREIPLSICFFLLGGAYERIACSHPERAARSRYG